MACKCEVAGVTESLGMKRYKCRLIFYSGPLSSTSGCDKGDESIHKERELLSLEYKLIIIVKTSD